MGELGSRFERASLLASKERWCWNLVCTTCGHHHFRAALAALAEGLNPEDDNWPVHNTEQSPLPSSKISAGRRPDLEIQDKILESFPGYRIDSIQGACRFPDWIGHLGILLFYTADAERSSLIVTRELAPQLMQLMKAGTSPHVFLQSRLEQQRALAWEDLELIEAALLSCTSR